MNLLAILAEHRSELNTFFSEYIDHSQGLRVGESSVVSKRLHQVDRTNPGQIVILSNLDAGQFYLGAAPERYVHLDVFHAPGLVANPEDVVKGLKDEMAIRFPGEDLPELAVETGKEANHLHILVPLAQSQYIYIPVLVNKVEEFLASQGVQIRKVEKLVHQEYLGPDFQSSSQITETAAAVTGFRGVNPFAWLSQKQQLLFLAKAVGSTQAAVEVLEALDPTVKVAPSIAQLSERHAGLTPVLNQLIQAGYAKRTLWGGYRLTDEGVELRKLANSRSKELEAEFKKIIRKVPVSVTELQPVSFEDNPRQRRVDSERGKIVPLEDAEWAGNIAVSETVIAAKKNNFLRGGGETGITRADLRVYRKNPKKPRDILLLIDASTSMRGKRLRAAVNLAEHLILTTKDRVGVVIFQNKEATVASEFTRNYELLRRGLHRVEAEGLTPLASGLVEGVKLLKKARAKNPLLILITDGLPTVPLCTSDPVADALEAVELIPQVKARLVVIGLKPDERFLRDLAKRGKGRLYMVDDLDQEALITIARQEKAN
ncbi:MAG: VWA domain-containing protein [Firmicutes bacterium]|nr:VWA domain-containing protein [Bacillota bacterium]